MSKKYLFIKRIIGIFGSIIGIFACFGLFWWWIFILNLFVTHGHPIFKQERIGKDGKTFKILKFRTMRYDTDPNLSSSIVNEEEYATRFGKFLRKTSLDETLQLINILKGDMAFIGPRPLIYYGDDKITIDLRKENGAILLRPGLSGYAQTNGRILIDAKTKAKFDSYYYQNISFKLDFIIFFESILLIFKH